MSHIPGHQDEFADDILDRPGESDTSFEETLRLAEIVFGKTNQPQVVRFDGNLWKFDPTKTPNLSILRIASPSDPDSPNIQFVTDPNTGTFFTYNSALPVGQRSTVISERELPGYANAFEASNAISRAGLNRLDYSFVWENKRVIPKLNAIIPATQSSFFTSTDASGQLILIDRTTGAHIPIGAVPSGADVPAGASVEWNADVGRFQVTQPNGTVSFVDPARNAQQPQGIDLFGQNFAFNPNTGAFTRVDREFEPQVIVQNGREFIRDANGNLTPLQPERTSTLDELINQRLLAGDADGAVALADFRDRPTSLEAFNAAMQIAQSPGDAVAISAIARGHRLVSPPPAGTVQRIAPPPDFLLNAFQKAFGDGTATSGDLVATLEAIAKENATQKKDLAVREKELAASKEKQSQLEIQAKIDAAIAPFRAQVGKLEKDAAVKTERDKFKIPASLQEGSPGLSEASQAALGEQPANVNLTPAQIELINTINAGEDVSGLFAGFRDAGIPASVITQTGTGTTSTTPGTAVSTITGATAGSGVSTITDSPSVNLTPARGGFVNPNTGRDTGSFAALEAELIPPKPSAAESRASFAETFASAQDEDDFFAHGGVFDDNTAIVGEKGPELAVFPVGTRIIPLASKKEQGKAKFVETLKAAGVKNMAHGGVVGPLLPIGVRRALSGGIIQPTRRRLSRAAGLPVLSAQARQNLLPEELDVFNRLSREAGIPEGAFEQEQLSALPGANLARRQSRFAARVRG